MTGPLRGRDPQLRALHERVAALGHGESGVVVVPGPAGSGKSRLLDEAVIAADAAGFRVHRGGGDPAAMMIPLAPLLGAGLSADEPLLDAGVLKQLAAAPDPRLWLQQELEERLEQAALMGPLVLVLDDLQWADAMTLRILRTLPQRLSTHAILWVLALREDEVPDTARELRTIGATVLELPPLSAEAVAELAQDVLGAVPDPDVVDVAGEMADRPFLLLEFLRGLREEGLTRVAADRASFAGRRVPARLRDSVARQVQRLSPQAQDLVQMASVLGRRFGLDHLALLLGRTPAALMGPLMEALEAELLVEQGDALAFRHDLVRDAVDVGLPPTVRLALRRQAIALMLQEEAPVVEVAPLLLQVAEPGDVVAIGVLRRAARDLAHSAPSDAAALVRRALELTPGDHPDRPGVVAEAVPLLFAAGATEEAATLAETALRGPLPPEAEARVRLGLAQICVSRSIGDVARHCRAALALPGLPAELRLRLQVGLTTGRMLAGDPEDLGDVARADLAAARVAGDRAAQRTALANLSSAAFHAHRYQEAIDAADEARSFAPPDGEDGVRGDGGLFDVWGAWLRAAAGRLDEALPRAEAGLRAANAGGRRPALRWWLSCRASVLLAAGELAAARADAEAVLKHVDDPTERSSSTIHAHTVLARVGLHTGDEAAVRAGASAAEAMMVDPATNVRRAGAWLAALVADANGDYAGAAALLEETVSVLGTPALVLAIPGDPADLLELLRVLLRAGDRSGAAAVAAEAERRAGLNPDSELLCVLARHARGLAESDLALLRATAGAVDVVPGPLVRAALLEDAGRAVVPGDAVEGVILLDAARAGYDACGAERDAARVRRHLREHGVRRRRPAPARPPSSRAGLTEAELAVVELAAAGATNRQVAERLFLSPHTVSSHLRHAFLKLGIRSRVDLAVQFSGRDEGADRRGEHRTGVR